MADISVTATSVKKVSGTTKDTQTKYMTAGATITAGQTVYQDASDNNEAKLADANSSATTAAVVGVALNGAADGQPVEVAYGGYLDFNAVLTPALIYINSTTAGGIAPVTDNAAGNYTTIIGMGYTTTRMLLANCFTAGVATT
jgi:hypothetical protein